MIDNFTFENAFKALEEVQEEIEVTPKVKEKAKVVNESLNKNTSKELKKIDYSYASRLSKRKGLDKERLEVVIDELNDGALDDLGYVQELVASKNVKGIEDLILDYYNDVSIDEPLKESKKINESPLLEPKHDARKSFYGKAEVVEEDGDKVLYSYGTKVAKITKDNKVELLSGSLPETRGYKVMLWCYSPTTLRHVKEFLKQNGFKAESKAQMEKDYVRKDESKKINDSKELKEGTKFNLKDDDQVKKAKEFKEDNSDKEDNIEKIVDVDASTVDELKDSYVGSTILQCPVCKTLIYKKPEELVKDEESGLYNIELECPHCGITKGFELIGQVAKLDAKEEEPKDEPNKDDVSNDNIDLGSIEGEKDDLEESKKEVVLENLDEVKFDKLINKYLHSVYENVESYTTTNGSIEDESNKLIMEGTIKYTSGKRVPTKFIFEATSITKHNLIKLKGLNESFSKARTPFTLIGRVKNNNLVCECLRYNYNTKTLNESKKVKGSVFLRDKKEKKK